MLRLMHTCYHVSPRNLQITTERTSKYYEVELYTGGTGYSVINNKKHRHSNGNILIAHPGDKRYSIGTFECHSFKFLPDNDAEYISAFKKLHGVSAIDFSEELIPKFKEIYLLSTESGNEICIDAAMRTIISLIYKKVVFDENKSSNYNESLEKAAIFIGENLDKKLTLSQIASAACMSASYFHRTFKSYFNGLSPNEYLLNKRIEYAKALLCDNSLSIDRVTEMSGFTTRAYFDVCFKSKVGITPASFRKKLNSNMY